MKRTLKIELTNFKKNFAPMRDGRIGSLSIRDG